MDNENLAFECAEYFKNRKGFKRIFESIKEKYRSLGTLGGTITIHNLTVDEKDALSGLLKKDYYSRKSASIKIERFIKALDDTRFQGVAFEKVIYEYFGEDILSKKEERLIYEKQKNEYFQAILSDFKVTRAYNWLSYVLEKRENAYRIISQRYDADKDSLYKDIKVVLRGLNMLSFDENNTIRLAIFSSIISKNPHCFDNNTECGKLLLYGIVYFLNMDFPDNAENRAEALYKAGVLVDEVSNFTLISGLIGYKKGVIHDGWKGFYEKSEPMQVTLWNLSEIDNIKSPKRVIFVFENPTVFSEVLYKTRGKRPPLMCTFGQVKLSSLVILDKLIDNVDKIYYSGDFDPEGIIIADRLKERYKEKLELWHFGVEDYFKIKSREKLSASRIKKLKRVKSKKLNEAANLIINEGLAGYQELLIDDYIKDIMSSI